MTPCRAHARQNQNQNQNPGLNAGAALPPRGARGQSGLTLIELLVAMALSLLVILATIAAVTTTRQSFGTVDAASQMRDNARFATTLIQQLAAQAGYKSLYYATYSQQSNTSSFTLASDSDTVSHDLYVEGLDASTISSGAVSTSSAVNNSDILILRTMAGEQSEITSSDDASTSATTDSATINCLGSAPTTAIADGSSLIQNYLFVRKESTDTEPALYCGIYDADTSAFTSVQPLIRGVETFQVLYGVNAVDDPDSLDSSSAFKYMRATTVTSSSLWKKVRTIRVGMVLRSASTALAEQVAQTFYPLGELYVSSSDAGSTFTSAADGRLRQVVTFTVELRNSVND